MKNKFLSNQQLYKFNNYIFYSSLPVSSLELQNLIDPLIMKNEGLKQQNIFQKQNKRKSQFQKSKQMRQKRDKKQQIQVQKQQQKNKSKSRGRTISQSKKLTNQSQSKAHDSSMIIDYLNAKYQGGLCYDSKQSNNSSIRKILKNGPGIVFQDELNFLTSNWKKNRLNGKTVLINSYGNFLYGIWNESLNAPHGNVVLKIKEFYLILRFSQSSGKWNMTQKNKSNVIIVIDSSKYCVLVLSGNVQQGSTGEYKSSKTVPFTVVEFSHIPFQNEDDIQTSKQSEFGLFNSEVKQPKRNIQKIIQFYAKKYNFKLEKHQLCLSWYLNQISENTQKKYLSSQQFAFNVSKSLIQNLFSKNSGQNKKSNFNMKTETYESQKQKIYSKNCIIFKQTSIGSGIKQQNFNYFGFLNGLGLKFTNERSKQSNGKTIKEKHFNLKSLGNHNQSMKIEDIGAKIFQNRCIEEGNFKTKNTLTYENPMFRPSSKLSSIYNKYHKTQIAFVNEYFDKGEYSVFKILTNLEIFLDDHITYIINQCYNQTTKFHVRQQNNELIEKLLPHRILSGISRLQESQVRNKLAKSGKNQNYQVQIQKKRTSKKPFDENQESQPINDLKNKNSELKQRIKKVKYQIQYQPLKDQQNTIYLTDGRFASKIKKHLCSANLLDISMGKNSHKSTSKHNRSRSPTIKQKKSREKRVYKIRKRGTSYIQQQKQKILSPQKKYNIDIDDSLQKIDNVLVKKLALKSNKNNDIKSEQQKLLERINNNIEFKEKFNYGIQYHIENQNVPKEKTERRRKSSQKNKYNGRSRYYTDDELDYAIEKNVLDPDRISPRTITPGKKSRKKEQYRHYIHSNKKKNQNNQEEKFYAQKQTQDAIRAQILGISLQQYKNRLDYKKKQQQFIQQKIFTAIQKDLSHQKTKTLLFDPNETFAFNQKQNKSLIQSSIRKDRSNKSSISRSIARIEDEDNAQQISLRQRNSFNNEVHVLHRPHMKQESLVEKRMRILQEFKDLNSRNKQKQVHNQILSSIKSTYGVKKKFNLKYLMQQQISPESQNRQIQYNRLPLYKQQRAKTVISPHRYIFTQIVQQKQQPQLVSQRPNFKKTTFLDQHDSSFIINQKAINKELSSYQHDRSGRKYFNKNDFSPENILKNPITETALKNKKYQYYFDK